MSIKDKVKDLLMSGWYSNFQINMEVKSSSGDRAARTLRQFPPEGYIMIQRPKQIEGYNNCLEFRLVKVGE